MHTGPCCSCCAPLRAELRALHARLEPNAAAIAPEQLRVAVEELLAQKKDRVRLGRGRPIECEDEYRDHVSERLKEKIGRGDVDEVLLLIAESEARARKARAESEADRADNERRRAARAAAAASVVNREREAALKRELRECYAIASAVERAEIERAVAARLARPGSGSSTARREEVLDQVLAERLGVRARS
jgi:hypothetical protein